MWLRLCDLLDLPQLKNDTRFATTSARRDNRPILEDLLNERFMTRDKKFWINALVEIGLPAGPIYDLAETFADPQVRHCRMVEEVTHPTAGLLRQLSSPLGLECLADGAVRSAPPLLGQHSHEILREFGFSDVQIATLETAGVIRHRPA
jgi:formyl-CoA transferase